MTEWRETRNQFCAALEAFTDSLTDAVKQLVIMEYVVKHLAESGL